MHSLFVPKFSTTTTLQTTIYQATLISATQQYFDFMFISLCGIPKVRLRGTPEDWKELRNKVDEIRKFGLDWWIEKLIPIIDKFVAAAVEGEKDRDFWNSVGKVVSTGGSGAVRYVNGWIANFFPYLDSEKNPNLRDLGQILETMKKLESESLSQQERVKEYNRMPTQKSIPVGIIDSPFTWNYLGDKIPMKFISGFIGIGTTTDGYIKPQVGWAIASKKNKKEGSED